MSLHPTFQQRVDDVESALSFAGVRVPEESVKVLERLSKEYELRTAAMDEAFAEQLEDHLEKSVDKFFRTQASGPNVANVARRAVTGVERPDGELAAMFRRRVDDKLLNGPKSSVKALFDVTAPLVKDAMKATASEAMAAWNELPEELRVRVDRTFPQFADREIDLSRDGGAEVDALKRLAAAWGHVYDGYQHEGAWGSESVLVHSLRLGRPITELHLKNAFDSDSASEYGDHGALTSVEKVALWLPAEWMHFGAFQVGVAQAVLVHGAVLDPIADVFGEDAEEFDERVKAGYGALEWVLDKMPRPLYAEELFDRWDAARDLGRVDWRRAGFQGAGDALSTWLDEHADDAEEVAE